MSGSDSVPIVRLPPLPLLALLVLAALSQPAWAQVQTFILQPGSNVGPATKVVPTNCVTGPDQAITCDTKLENPPSNTPAKPQYSPFKN